MIASILEHPNDAFSLTADDRFRISCDYARASALEIVLDPGTAQAAECDRNKDVAYQIPLPMGERPPRKLQPESSR